MRASAAGPLPRPLRVGLVIGQLTYGGAESQLYELAKGLARAGMSPVVYCLSAREEPYGPLLRQIGVPLRVLPSRGSFDVTRVLGLARALRRDGIELVHAFLFLGSAYAYLATRIARGAALVTSARNCKPEPNPARRMILRRAFTSSDAVICNSHEMARFAERLFGVPAEAVRVVYNGVDLSRFAPASAQPRGGGLRVGTIGRIERQKNLDLFIEAARRILQTRPTALFEVAGVGSLRPELERRVDALGLAGSIRFVGATADVPGFLGRLDQFWLTSDWEGTPNVVLEAMAAGVPVIATAVGGTPEVVEPEGSGILVPAGGIGELVEASERLAAQPELARRMGVRARELAAERFSVAAMIETTEEVYTEVGRKRAGSPRYD